ncbi:YbaK protein domain-containing protein [Desulfonema limicola]|uniref:Cys-tRNA(Pro)/Cys-tRNA(Cys) deacylase n=1 Tax=Desulfonema limicola TaxID=45656 RepID=A0A975GII0_9BACT|nr:aminoacyl-tRNA deacylase [Desulfonema limicola]QTA81973.1 YbaK protein domain-containing protein [Desulfonema limicola]
MKKTTRATQFLSKKGIDFKVIQYKHDEKGAEFASKATGFPLERTIKTLVADLGSGKYVLAMMPGDRQLSLKNLAKASSAKKAVMADTGNAERITGYLVGGISPFGIRQKVPAVMDISLLEYDSVVINAGQRGVMLQMSPKDIIKVLNCKAADLAHNP